jgi:tRNA(fMet)-specific endonuclease VapC
MRYMLDTNICVYIMKRRPPQVAQRFGTLRLGEALMSAITLAELQYGVRAHPNTREHNERALNALLEDLPAVPFGNDAAASYGVIRALAKDRRRDALDRLIAAHALSLGFTLVTNNEADFKDYPGLLVENWVSEQ